MDAASLTWCRRKIGISQTAMAERIGYSRTHYTLMENGHRPVLARTEKLVLALLLSETGLQSFPDGSTQAINGPQTAIPETQVRPQGDPGRKVIRAVPAEEE